MGLVNITKIEMQKKAEMSAATKAKPAAKAEKAEAPAADAKKTK
jgi:hypothetical protein